jgi:hypothetical protein
VAAVVAPEALAAILAVVPVLVMGAADLHHQSLAPLPYMPAAGAAELLIKHALPEAAGRVEVEMEACLALLRQDHRTLEVEVEVEEQIVVIQERVHQAAPAS